MDLDSEYSSNEAYPHEEAFSNGDENSYSDEEADSGEDEDSYSDEEADSGEDEEEAESESKLMSLFTQLFLPIFNERRYTLECANIELKELISYIIQIISLVTSLESETHPKSKSELMSLIIQTKYVFKSMDLDSQPKPLSKLISFFTELTTNHTNSESSSATPDATELESLMKETIALEPEPEFISLIYRILSLVNYLVVKSKSVKFVKLCPQAQVSLRDDNTLHLDEQVQSSIKYDKWKCLQYERRDVRLAFEGKSSYFFCSACMGQNHERYEKFPIEIKHPLHPKHSLRLVFLKENSGKRMDYCYLGDIIYCCLACNYAMDRDCIEKPTIVSIDSPKWHEHPLDVFSRTTSLICDLCALADPTCLYICPPCGFVAHESCLDDLARVIRISRHPHRISFTPSFSQGNWSCGVCRKEIHNDYGGYICTKSGCSYAAHSRCATQANIWDGEDLEGVPEEDDIGDVEPFVKISDGIIQHFSHEHHHLRLDENTDRDYDENKMCQACITPIYFGKLYTCMQCDFILHEECANLPRKKYHPAHRHLLTLVRRDGDDTKSIFQNCSGCTLRCTVGLFYECCGEGCDFKVHVQCGVISEPLVHASHMHPLFLTSKPYERRECSVCTRVPHYMGTNETFNCIECEFSLCFRCATLPQKVRYKYDKHMFSLAYEEETSTTLSWCEVCEGKIGTEEGFYACDEDCCVTLHIQCTIGRNRYMKPGSSWFLNNNSWISNDKRVDVVPNKQQMTRPICSHCKRRFSKVSLQMPETGKVQMEGSVFCSISCMVDRYYE